MKEGINSETMNAGNFHSLITVRLALLTIELICVTAEIILICTLDIVKLTERLQTAMWSKSASLMAWITDQNISGLQQLTTFHQQNCD